MTAPVRRHGTFDRTASRALVVKSMSVLWAVSKQAGRDLSVTRFQHASLVAALEVVELELSSILQEPGMQALLDDDIGTQVTSHFPKRTRQ